ncbi:MAG: hypothetical protein GC192_20295 [Bacteroidetes bacterium]|nr:hypothetical protein [Bacteroidota bacterium]
MIPKENSYPVFESNQVLTNAHLNQMLEYLDEQTRLSRTNLIGVGVVCGLEVSWDEPSATITVTKGCGVTTEGYLVNLAVVGDETGNCTPFLITDFSTDRFKAYTVPNKPGYAKFHNGCDSKKPQYELWQLIPASAADYDTATELDADFLKDKVALLHVEINSEQLKNCSPNSCDDKGSETAFTVRPLLISSADAEKLIIGIPGQDTMPNLPERLGLPDIRMPRLNVPNSNMVDARMIFDAYQDLLVGNSVTLFDKIGKALAEAYQVFGPIVKPVRPNFQFVNKLQSLENQFRSLFQFSIFGGSKFPVYYAQYYYDLLSDLIQAYDEFRWKGLELLSLCCPHEQLFPRHLLLGEVFSERADNWRELRHYFRPSLAIAHAETKAEEVRHLFERIVLMIEKFRITTKLPEGIRITPSRLGEAPLSKKSIPYYYFDEDGETPLYQRWNYKKTKKGRANQNLGYFSFNYGTDDFVKNPLGYDLEPYNFFRIEGHIGRNWTEVLKTLMTAIRTFRLPFDVVVLNADNLAVEDKDNPWKNRCIDNDLDVIHRIWVNEINCLYQQKIGVLTRPDITKGLAANNVLTIGKDAAPAPATSSSRAAITGLTASFVGATVVSAKPALTIAAQPALFSANTFATAALLPSTSPIFTNVNPTTSVIGSSILENIDKTEINSPTKLKLEVTKQLANSTEFSGLSLQEYKVVAEQKVNVVADMLAVTEELAKPVKSLNYTQLEKKFTLLDNTIQDYLNDLVLYNPNERGAKMTEAEVQALIRELQALQSSCLRKRLAELKAEMDAKQKAVEELIWFSRYATNHPDLQHKAGVPVGGTFVLVFRETPNDVTNGDIVLGGRRLLGYDIPEGKVLADFYVPNRCCSDCPPVKFVLPPSRPVFNVTLGCPNDNDIVFATIEVTHGIAPFEIRIDGGEYQLLNGGVELNPGEHDLVVRDSEGGESLSKKVTTGQRMLVRELSFECDPNQQFYEARLRIEHGQPPFKINDEEAIHEEGSGEDEGVFFIKTPTLPSGQTSTVLVSDSRGCEPISLELNHDCAAPVVVAQPDTSSTEVGTPVIIDVLANDTGQNLTLTEAKLSNPAFGTVVINVSGSLTYTPSPQAVGQDVVIEYEVRDSNGNSASSTATVNVNKKDCNLPGDGKALSCLFPFWMQAPVGDEKYEVIKVDFAKFTVLGGTNLRDIIPPFPTDPALFTANNFHDTVGKWVSQLNDKVQSNLPQAQQGWWNVAYKPSNGYALLRIEYFTTQDFALEVGGDLRIDKIQTKFTSIFTMNGANVTERNISLDSQETSFLVKPFDCVELDKCIGLSNARCNEDTPKIRINIKEGSRQGNRVVVQLEAVDLVGTIADWYWDMGQGISEKPLERLTVATFRRGDQNAQVQVQVLGFTEKGCFGQATALVDLDKFV